MFRLTIPTSAEREVVVDSSFAELDAEAVNFVIVRRPGFFVVEVSCADEALSCSRGQEMVDLVFSDIQMPGSLDGLELARQLRKAHPTLPIILTSGNTEPERAGDFSLFIQKPYRLGRAVQAVFEMLRLKGCTAEG